MLKRIYVFHQFEKDGQFDFVALAEDGECLSTWHPESQESAKTEAWSAERLERYDRHYPTGWELVWRGGPINPDTMPSHEPDGRGSVAFFEGRAYHQFLRALTV